MSAIKMYQVKPIFEANHEISLSSCMYKMKNLHGSKMLCDVTTNENEDLAARINIMEQVKRVSKQPLPEVALLEQQQEDILGKLAMLKDQIEKFRKILNDPVQKKSIDISRLPLGLDVQDIVVYASLSHPPYSVLAMNYIWGVDAGYTLSNHVHSSVQMPLPDAILRAFPQNCVKRQGLLHITLVWKEVGPHLQIIVSPTRHTVLAGEVTLLRLLSRMGPTPQYLKTLSDEQQASEDWALDLIYQLVAQKSSSKKLLAIALAKFNVSQSEWLFGSTSPSIVDAALWSYFKNTETLECPEKLKNWMNNCNKCFLK